MAAKVGRTGRPSGVEEDPFVGREEELRILLTGVRRALDGGGGGVVVRAAAGMGKTRLLAELARQAERRGMVARAASCADADADPLAPWWRLAGGPAEAVPLADGPPEVALLDRLHARFAALARRQPTLLLLEDLHRASPAALEILRHLGGALADLPLLLVATTRDLGRTRGDALGAAIAGLAREPAFALVELHGWSDAEVRRYAEAAALVDLTQAEAAALRHRTAGNPRALREALHREAAAPPPPPPDAGPCATRDVMEAALERALAGEGGLLLLAGEAGSGKSCAAEQLAARARSAGARVARGRCLDRADTPPLWPWRQIARALADAGAPPLPAECANAPAPGERFALFDRVTRALAAAARDGGLLLVLEDLHWADEDSLLLLRFVTRELRQLPVLVLATHREISAARQPPLARALAELLRDPAARRIELAPWGDEEIAALFAHQTGRAAPAATVAEIRRRSDGNPLFARELIRQCAHRDAAPGSQENDAHDEPAETVVPPLIAAVLRARLVPLSSECQAVLSLAAVLGREFGGEPIERMVAQMRPQDAVSAGGPLAAGAVAVLQEAVDAGLLHGPSQTRSGRYRFAHRLLRELIYAELPRHLRRALHAHAAAALERAPEGETAAAEHAARAVDHRDPSTARRGAALARRAAEASARRLAWREAGRLYRLALAALESGGQDAAGAERERAALRLELGRVLELAGESEAAHEVLDAALQQAERDGDATMFAAATLARAGRSKEIGARDEDLLARLEEAIAFCSGPDAASQARLLARLAGELAASRDHGRAAEVGARAVATARASGDVAALTAAATAHVVNGMALSEPTERLALLDEVAASAQRTGDIHSAAELSGWRVDALLELGDIGALEVEIERHRRLADELLDPTHLWLASMFDATIALHQGDLGLAERLVATAGEVGARSPDPNPAQAHASQLFLLRSSQGRLVELEGPVTAIAERYPGQPAWRVGLARIYVESGRLSLARPLLSELAASGFATLPRDRSWVFNVALLCETAAAVEEPAAAALLLELIRPYASRNVALTGGVLSCGSAARYAGLVAAVLGRWDEADASFAAALEHNTRMRAREAVGWTQHDHARLLLRRGSDGDRQRAAALHAAASATAGALRLPRLADRLATLVPALREAASRAVPESETAALEPTFRCEGDYWSLAFAGRETRLRDTRGLQYLARLLDSPGMELLALDLASGSVSAQRPRSAADDAGMALLDARARSAYRERLRDLGADLEEAEQAHDLGRVEALRAEMEALRSQLVTAVGLGGRARRVPAELERARSAVAKRIKSEIRRIAATHPQLGEHLRESVSTGYSCSYRPAAKTAWRLR